MNIWAPAHTLCKGDRIYTPVLLTIEKIIVSPQHLNPETVTIQTKDGGTHFCFASDLVECERTHLTR